jgi:hypothetical protein
MDDSANPGGCSSFEPDVLAALAELVHSAELLDWRVLARPLGSVRLGTRTTRPCGMSLPFVVVQPKEETMEGHPKRVRCSRCGRKGTMRGAGNTALVPDGWEGHAGEAVCRLPVRGVAPALRVAHRRRWNPRRSRDDSEAGARTRAALRCEYLDLAVAWVDDGDWPEEWMCPDCGGTEFVGVYRDYPLSGMHGSSFVIEVEDFELGDDD